MSRTAGSRSLDRLVRLFVHLHQMRKPRALIPSCHLDIRLSILLGLETPRHAVEPWPVMHPAINRMARLLVVDGLVRHDVSIRVKRLGIQSWAKPIPNPRGTCQEWAGDIADCQSDERDDDPTLLHVSGERQGQRREPAAGDARNATRRAGWLPFAGPPWLGPISLFSIPEFPS
jgi:hypothetical protein